MYFKQPQTPTQPRSAPLSCVPTSQHTSACAGLWASSSAPASHTSFPAPLTRGVGGLSSRYNGPGSHPYSASYGLHQTLHGKSHHPTTHYTPTNSLHRWLVRKGRYEDAKKAVSRLTDGSVNVEAQVAMMKRTTDLEIETKTGSSYAACFKGTNLRRTEIACVVWGIQAGVGNPLQSMYLILLTLVTVFEMLIMWIGYTTYFFKQAGLSTSDAFKFNIGNNATSFVGTMLAWPLLFYFGRRTVFMGGLCVMTVLYFAIGFAGIPSIQNVSANWARSSLLVVYLFVYCPTVGATVYPIVGEVGSTKLRGKTVALARNFYSIVSIVSGVLVPYMLSPTAWDWSAKAGFFFGGIAIFCLVWTFFRLPEMKVSCLIYCDGTLLTFLSRIVHTKSWTFCSSGSYQREASRASMWMRIPTTISWLGRRLRQNSSSRLLGLREGRPSRLSSATTSPTALHG